jgi:hypothetical protein
MLGSLLPTGLCFVRFIHIYNSFQLNATVAELALRASARTATTLENPFAGSRIAR